MDGQSNEKEVIEKVRIYSAFEEPVPCRRLRNFPAYGMESFPDDR
jgi:hypothetical protein